MHLPFKVSTEDIEALSDVQLTNLLHRLLLLEAQKLGLPKRLASVSLNIDIPDGGEDGRVSWEGGPNPEESNWLPRRLTLFQAKATYTAPADCKSEVLSTADGESALKRRVADIVANAGSYVLFYSRHCEGQHVESRVAKFREAFAEVVGEEAANAVHVDVYGTEKIATWTNEYAAAAALVLEYNGRSIPSDLQTWESWEETYDTLLGFHSDTDRSEIARLLSSSLDEPHSVARIAGLSGLGKSRLALELFRPPTQPGEDPKQAALSSACVYAGDGAGSYETLRRTMLSFMEHEVHAVIIVDECPLEVHLKLQEIAIAPKSRMSLITLDYDPTSEPKSSRCQFYRLEPFDDEDVATILQESHVGIPEEYVTKVVEIAQGFPKMAHLLVEAIRDDRTNLWELANEDVIGRLVVRRSSEPELLFKVARALSVFEHIGVEGVAKHQLERFAEHLCGETANDVYRIICDLEAAGIAYRRGDYVRIILNPSIMQGTGA